MLNFLIRVIPIILMESVLEVSGLNTEFRK